LTFKGKEKKRLINQKERKEKLINYKNEPKKNELFFNEEQPFQNNTRTKTQL
jgi:hypothetical protein